MNKNIEESTWCLSETEVLLGFGGERRECLNEVCQRRTFKAVSEEILLEVIFILLFRGFLEKEIRLKVVVLNSCKTRPSDVFLTRECKDLRQEGEFRAESRDSRRCERECS